MRKSAAPSVRKAVKRIKSQREEVISSTTPCNEESDVYSWGSSKNQCSSSWDDKQHDIYKNVLDNKKVFTIVWREISSKKNKIWIGDGTLEVDIKTCKAILKDDTGKYLGSSGKVNCNELDSDLEMTIGNKEIQILDKVTTIAELSKLKKQQFENRAWGEEECLMEEETFKKPKGAFVFKCPLNIDRPQLQERRQSSKLYDEAINIPLKNEILSVPKKETFILKECVCLLRPSELQQILFEQVQEYYSRNKSTQKEDLLKTLEDICNHPSLINNEKTSNSIRNFLQPYLPEWSDMGPCDSSKLEFLQYFIIASALQRKERTIIIANNNRVLNMLQDLIHYLNIKSFRLKEANSFAKNTAILEDFNSCILESGVIFVEPKALHSDLLEVSNLIYFNCFPVLADIINRIKNSKSILHVYYLITTNSYEMYMYRSFLMRESFSVPVEQIFDMTKNITGEGLLKDLHLSEFETKWEYFKEPFTETIIQEAKLQEFDENLLSILFCSKKLMK